jgi:hypothetical protein
MNDSSTPSLPQAGSESRPQSTGSEMDQLAAFLYQHRILSTCRDLSQMIQDVSTRVAQNEENITTLLDDVEELETGRQEDRIQHEKNMNKSILPILY